MRRATPPLTVLALLVLLTSDAVAGPWTKSGGEIYLKLSEGVFLSGDFVDPRASSRGAVVGSLAPENLSLTTALYSEVGLFQGLHLQAYVPFVVGRNSFASGSSYLSRGGGDLVLGVQWTPGVFAFPHALRADVKVPLYDVGQPKGFEAVRFPARGDGQIDSTIWISLGDSLSILPAYAFAELGHRFRTSQFVGEGDGLAFLSSFVFAGQLGYKLGEQLVLAGNLNGVVPYGTDAVTKGYLTLGGAVFLPVLGGWSLEASLDGVAWAKNSSRGLSVGLGVSYRT